MALRRQSRRGASSSRSPWNDALVAAAESLSDKVAGQQSTTIGEAWQVEIEKLFYRVPELRTSAMITGRAMGQCRLLLARVAPNGEPVPLDIGTIEKPGKDANHPGVKMLAKFAGGAGGQTELLELAGQHLSTTGESILIGKLDPTQATLLDDFDRIQAYAPMQVKSYGKTIKVQTQQSTQLDREVNTDDGYTSIRIWRQDPFRKWLADSPAKASIGVLREIALYDDRIRATAVSRLGGPGLLFINEDITLPVAPSAEDEPMGDGTLDPFMVLMMEVMSLAMKNQDSAAARVPILMRAKDPKNAAELLTFDSPFDDKILELRDSALNRFAVAVDMPPEMLSGVGDIQHWTGALITEDWKRTYLPELMGLFCGSLTSGWYIPALVAAGYGDQPNDVIVWYDDSSVRTKENSAVEALGAYDRNEISGDALRRILGLDAGDAPDLTTVEGKRQLALQLVLKAPALAPALAKYIGLESVDWNKILPGGTTPGGADAHGLLPGQGTDGRVTPPTTGPAKAEPSTSSPAPVPTSRSALVQPRANMNN